jgi:hypothetical protein
MDGTKRLQSAKGRSRSHQLNPKTSKVDGRSEELLRHDNDHSLAQETAL